MVRTRDTAGVKVGAKAPRKGLSGPSTSSAASSSGKKPREDGGGNPVCPRETPAWQKPITDFFRQASSKTDHKMEDDVGSSDTKENVKPDQDNVPDAASVEGKESIEVAAGKSSESD